MRNSRFLEIEEKELFSKKELFPFRDMDMVEIYIWAYRYGRVTYLSNRALYL